MIFQSYDVKGCIDFRLVRPARALKMRPAKSNFFKMWRPGSEFEFETPGLSHKLTHHIGTCIFQIMLHGCKLCNLMSNTYDKYKLILNRTSVGPNRWCLKKLNLFGITPSQNYMYSNVLITLINLLELFSTFSNSNSTYSTLSCTHPQFSRQEKENRLVWQ